MIFSAFYPRVPRHPWSCWVAWTSVHGGGIELLCPQNELINRQGQESVILVCGQVFASSVGFARIAADHPSVRRTRMAEQSSTIVIEEERDPAANHAARAQRERFNRNWAWLEAHAKEVYSHRRKVVCIAGEELFVGDSSEAVLAKARAAHPNDDGRVTRIIPKERGSRIYAL
jgi:hypothetical protein